MKCKASFLAASIAWILMLPLPGCATTLDSPPHAAGRSDATGDEISPSGEECDAISTLPEKRACFARQDSALIDACERMRPLHCKPYREMYTAEDSLRRIEVASIRAARKAYASYADGDETYVADMESYARDANAAWRAYRDAQCRLEPLAQGMSRTLAEDLAEACRVKMTVSRIEQIKALYAPTEDEEAAP